MYWQSLPVPFIDGSTNGFRGVCFASHNVNVSTVVMGYRQETRVFCTFMVAGHHTTTELHNRIDNIIVELSGDDMTKMKRNSEKGLCGKAGIVHFDVN